MRARWSQWRDALPPRDQVREAAGVAFGIVVSVLAWATMLGAAYGLGWLAPISWLWGR